MWITQKAYLLSLTDNAELLLFAKYLPNSCEFKSILGLFLYFWGLLEKFNLCKYLFLEQFELDSYTGFKELKIHMWLTHRSTWIYK
jgi:hypothetical protein